MSDSLELTILPEEFAICRLSSTSQLPQWAMQGSFWSITRTTDELSIVCASAHVPQGINCEVGWTAFQVIGPLDFALVGVLSSLTNALAKAGISLFALSTFDTDYLLVRSHQSETARQALINTGCTFPSSN